MYDWNYIVEWHPPVETHGVRLRDTDPTKEGTHLRDTAPAQVSIVCNGTEIFSTAYRFLSLAAPYGEEKHLETG